VILSDQIEKKWMTIFERKWNSSGWHQEYDEAQPDSHIMERQYVNMLKNMHQAPTEWTFCDEHKYVLKLANDRTATAIGPKNEQNSYSCIFLTFQIWTFLFISLLWFRIIAKTLRTCTDQGPHTRSWKDAPATDHTTR